MKIILKAPRAAGCGVAVLVGEVAGECVAACILVGANVAGVHTALFEAAPLLLRLVVAVDVPLQFTLPHSPAMKFTLMFYLFCVIEG